MRRRVLKQQTGGQPALLLYWDYTMGLPEENGWDVELLNGGTVTMTEDGMLLDGGSNYGSASAICTKNLDVSAEKFKMTVVFQPVEYGPFNVNPFCVTYYSGFVIQEFSVPSATTGGYHSSGTNLANIFFNLTVGNLYTVEAEFDGEKVLYYLNGNADSKFDNKSDDTTPKITIKQQRGGKTLLQMIKIEKLD